MSVFGLLILAAVIALPVAWLVSEFRGGRPLRITLGLFSIAVTTVCVSALYSALSRFNYNAWYGGATKDLIETSLTQIEDGHLNRVLTAWRGLSSQYQPTYENRTGYLELAAEATARIRGDRTIAPDARWDVPVFSRHTWAGHWENDTGNWIVIHDTWPSFDVWRSGTPPTLMHAVSVSDDFRVLKFKEDGRWLHTLTLKNKYEATHEWFDMEKQAVWQTETMNKLRRATEDQKRMTQQADPPAAAPAPR
jgi:hypothetical protein